MAYSFTKLRKLSMGNRIAYQYKLTDVQTSGSVLYTPFKKITGTLIETSSSTSGAGAGTIAVASKTVADGNGTSANITFKASANNADGTITVVGLL